MPRPRICRRVNGLPEVSYFKPRGVPLRELNEVYLPIEGLEALRLADVMGLNQEEAAESMGVSRQTFGRILAHAHTVVAKALVSGSALCIQGGDYRLAQKSRPHDKATSTAVHAAQRFSQQTPYTRAEEEHLMDKIAISSEGPTLEDQLDPRFGRAAGFIIIDPRSLDFEYVDNGTSQAMSQGAGIQAAETIAAKGVKALLTGYVGPKAFMALEAAGIQVGQNLENMTVRQALERFQQGEIQWAQAPNRQGHGR